MSGMSGKGSVRFSELFKDTVECHGILWSWQFYKTNGMPDWEFGFWLRATRPQV